MNPLRFRDGLLVSLGLTALAAYVLACASFSPDDSKVLYPAYDARTGAPAVALYDRRDKTTATVFVLPSGGRSGSDRSPLRPQWTPDGRYMVVAWGDQHDDDQLNVLMLPVGGKGTTRLHRIPEVGDAPEKLLNPLALAGPYLFTCVESNVLLRLDLATGETRTNSYRGELALYPSARGDVVYYLGDGTTREGAVEIGGLDLDRLTPQPLLTLPEAVELDEGAVAFGRNGKDVAVMAGNKSGDTLLITRGKEWAQRSLPEFPGEKTVFGQPAWSADGSRLYASYCSEPKEGTGYRFGVAEIPVDGGTARRTPLIEAKEGSADDAAAAMCPIGLSNDGRTIGVSSTYFRRLDGEEVGKGSDWLALYLVDVSTAARKVTKVPIALPKRMAN